MREERRRVSKKAVADENGQLETILSPLIGYLWPHAVKFVS